MKLSEMRQLLAAEGIQLTKSLGQNFLHDANQLARILQLAALQPSDHVLEIGPGLGPLTERLLDAAGHVIAIEKDRRLAVFLEKRFAGRHNFELIVGDALEHARQHPGRWAGWQLVSNLPYSVASPILVELANNGQGPQTMTVTLQLEVVQRLRSQPGDPDYGLLTVLLRVFYEAVEWFKIPGSCFFPRPDIDSGCIKLARGTQVAMGPDHWQTFVAVTKTAFSQRRKMMFKLLKARWPEAKLAAAFASLGLPTTIRAEEVSPQQFVELGRALQS